MPISPDDLPAELHYIISLAELHGSDARVLLFDSVLGRHVPHAEKLTKDALRPLGELYNRIVSQGHQQLVRDWQETRDTAGTCSPETTWPVDGLFLLFTELGKKGIAPFNDGKLPAKKKPVEVLDWSKLPKSLRYLAGPAEVYGALQFDDPIFEFLQKRMTTDEQEELKELKIRYSQDFEAIESWLDEISMTKHPEARLVYFTGYLLAMGGDLGLL